MQVKDSVKLLSVNVLQQREIIYNGKPVMTGIYKKPVNARVTLREINLDGDDQADRRAHGGPDKAVYVYSIENYAYWREALNRDDFSYGQFGENFTVEGMTEDAIHVGDQFRVGGALVQVTQPRVPCFKLAHKMGLPDFVKQFMAAQRIGFYLRVLEAGEVGAGDSIERVKTDPVGLSVREVFHLLYFDKTNVAGARRALEIEALSPGWRGSFEQIIAKQA